MAPPPKPVPASRIVHLHGGRLRLFCATFRRMLRIVRQVVTADPDFVKRQALYEHLNFSVWDWSEICVRPYRAWLRQRQRVIAVVGSLGKTTTTRATLCVFTGQTPAWAHQAQNCFASVAGNLLRQSPFAKTAVVEAGIGGPAQMARYAALLQPDIVIMQALASDHQRKLGGPEGIWREKVRMVRALGTDGVAVLQGDDPAVLRMASETRAQVITFGQAPSCTVSVAAIETLALGTHFTLRLAGRSWPVRSRLIGRFALQAQLAAAAAGYAAGLPPPLIVERLERLTPTPGRMQPMVLSNGAVAIVDDFKGGYETVLAALTVLGEIRAPRRFVVLGDLYHPQPPRVARYHEIGALAAQVADRLLTVGRWAELYRRGWTATRDANEARTCESLDHVITLLRTELRPGDIVLLKGRGELKLSRIALALAGAPVGCRRVRCDLENIRCAECPSLVTPTCV